MSGEGKSNGVDLAAIYGAVLAISAELKAVRTEIASVRAEMATRGELADLREEVRAYHGAVIGHGILITELEDRVGRLERGEPAPRAA